MFVLQRIAETPNSTHAILYNGSARICEILERGAEDPVFPRIAEGTHPLRFHGPSKFDVAPYNSPQRFASIGLTAGHMIEIVVAGRVAILFHCGNTFRDSEGCPMTGESVALNFGTYEIPGGQSAPAFEAAWPILSKAVAEGGAMLQVLDIAVVKSGAVADV